MKKQHLVLVISFIALLVPVFFVSAAPLKLSVPYISEVPDGKWFGSWKNACEEASIAMVDRYYAGMIKTTTAWQKAYMSNLFVIERRLWKSDANTDVAMTVKLINDNSSFGAFAKEAPSIDDIKKELDAGRPVIAPIDGFKLANKNIPFLASGSGYHMFVIIGYDDEKRVFIVHDNGDLKEGVNIEYGYDRVMETMRDYSFARKKTDGPARAVFTYPKLAKTAGSHRIYFLNGSTKQYVSHPLVFGQKGWGWSWVNIVSDAWLRGLEDGPTIGPK